MLPIQLDKLKDTLRIAERAITENIFQPKQALYRNLPILQGTGSTAYHMQGCTSIYI